MGYRSPPAALAPIGRLAALILAAAASASAPAALAHGGEDLSQGHVFAAWSLSPGIGLPILIVLAIYLRGAARRRFAAHPPRAGRHILFGAGMLALFLALQSPLDPMGERLFLAHQIQHMLLRMTGPMLIVLARPQAVLVAGLPASLRRRLVVPVMTAGAVAGPYRHLVRPLPAFVVFVLSLYLWQIPRVHDVALRDEAIHWSMHLTMLAAGFVFFAMIFDRRDLPTAPPHFLRIALLFGAIVSNIGLGAVTVFKTAILYSAYDDEPGRLFGMAALADETAGGFVLWVPASMMLIIAILVVVYDWNLTETQRLRRGHGISGGGGAAIPSGGATASGRLALMLGAGALTMFGLVLGTGALLVSLG